MKINDVVRSQLYVSMELAKCLPDLLVKMVGNRITFDVETNEDIHKDDLSKQMWTSIFDFCEKNNQGRWSSESTAAYFDDDDNLIVDENIPNKGVIAYITVYFETTLDADRFVKNFLVWYKLSN